MARGENAEAGVLTVLSLRNVSASYGSRRVIDQIDLDVQPHEVVGIIGPNGAGKSTLMKAALGLCSATGQIAYAGKAMMSLDAVTRARFAAYVPQDREAAWALPVEDLVGLGRLPYRRTAFAPATANDRFAIARAMADMDIQDLGNRSLAELSGGEKARVLIARALAQETPLLFADEPTAGLDPAHQIMLLGLLRRRASEGQAVVLTLHELHLAARWCDRLVLLDGGRIVSEGTSTDVLTTSRIADVYGCLAFVGADESGPIIVPTGIIPGRMP
jgi:iron complex transport system ATP-binding protein